MALAPGVRLGVYEVTAQLGEGGMGQVWRARDTQLNRDVALKVLPDAFAADPDRLARFAREAQTLAALNHPNIAQIYGIEGQALVMELVEGEDLSTIIARRQPEGESVSSSLRDANARPARGGGARRGLDIDDAVHIAKQIADALEAAHEQGIIHRDLKPANIKLKGVWSPTPTRLPDGRLEPTLSVADVTGATVKVLDFGLAKAVGPEGAVATADAMNSPTLTARATEMGMILGTAAYMSPEQARGRVVDKRTDVWAFGCVLYEMLAGRRAFEGEDVSITLASVLKDDVRWDALPADLPARIENLLRRCLEKDPRKRLRDIGEARLTLEDPASLQSAPSAMPAVAAAVVPPASYWRRALPWAVAVAGLGAALMQLVLWPPWRTAPATAVQRHTVDLGVDASLVTTVGTAAVLSPDGQTLVFAAQPTGGSTSRLYVRRLDQLDATTLPGTEDGTAPFFSPDGQWVGFFATGKLKKVALAGGPPMTLGEARIPRGAWWTASEEIVFLPMAGGGSTFRRMPADGGEPAAFIEPDTGASQRWPQVLPDGRALLYTRSSPAEGMEIQIQPLPTGQRRSLGPGGFGRYLPSGHILFVRDGTLFAVRFDLEALSALGEARAVLEGIANIAPDAAQFAVSDNGTLAYVPDEADDEGATIEWLEQSGRTTPLLATPRDRAGLTFDRSGRFMAFDQRSQRGWDILVYDVGRGVANPIEAGSNVRDPAWTPDGQRIAFVANRGGQDQNIHWRRVDGSGEAQALTTGQTTKQQPAWHPDGRTLAYVDLVSPFSDLMRITIEGDEKSGWRPGPPAPIFQSPYQESVPAFSPDGRWIAYVQAGPTGRDVWVRPFPESGAPVLVSDGPGSGSPTWSETRNELFYTSRTGATEQIMVVPYVVDGASFRPERARAWTTRRVALNARRSRSVALHPDGRRFATSGAAEEAPVARQNKLVFVFNFFDELRRVTGP